MKAFQEWIERTRIVLALVIATFAVTAGKAQVRPGDFDVTDGKIERAPGKRLKVSTKEMRATLKFTTEQSATVKFTYLGPTKEVAHLGSGEVRSQFGIRLRAHDDCNAVYVIWHFAPDQRIAVSVKRNPGKRTHADCLDHGYINNIKPRILDLPQPVEVNQPHSVHERLGPHRNGGQQIGVVGRSGGSGPCLQWPGWPPQRQRPRTVRFAGDPIARFR